MPAITAEEKARKDAAALALQAPTIPPEQQALHDAAVHERARLEAEALAKANAEAAALPLPEGWVYARVLRKGDGKVFTGQIDATVDATDPEAKFTRFKFGAVIPLPGKVALAQENNGHVEVQAQYRAMLGLPEEN